MSFKKFLAVILSIAILVTSVMITAIADDASDEGGPVNLALSATATATDFHGSFPVTNINDGGTAYAQTLLSLCDISPMRGIPSTSR